MSWIRRRDFQLLTVGLSTYSSDDRFLVEHARHMGHWSLRIKSVRDEDKGLYECQLSIHPTQSIFIELKVIGKFFFIIIFLHHTIIYELYIIFFCVFIFGIHSARYWKYNFIL